MLRLLTMLTLWLTASPVTGQSDSLIVTLLGTGTPNPRIDRLGPSVLVEAGGRRLVFDAGRGTTIRLEQAGVRTGSVTAVFITHHHSDHTIGIPDLWLTGWLPPFGGRNAPFRLIGPSGTTKFADGLATAFSEDVRIRHEEERLPLEGARIVATEFAKDTVVYEDGGIRVEAFEVDHGGALRPAYGYRVTFSGRSVVISGDTKYSDNLVRHSQGADVLLHEVVMAPPEIHDQPAVRFVLDHHTSPAEAARIFDRTKPRLAVFTHFAFPPNRVSNTVVTVSDVLAEAAQYYRGPMEAGEDLMRIIVGDSIRVERRSPPR